MPWGQNQYGGRVCETEYFIVCQVTNTPPPPPPRHFKSGGGPGDAGLQITAGQRTMSGQNWVLTGQILGLPNILSGPLPTRSKKF